MYVYECNTWTMAENNYKIYLREKRLEKNIFNESIQK